MPANAFGVPMKQNTSVTSFPEMESSLNPRKLRLSLQ
ncbi:hypothetical protein ACHAWC_005380 [Mediolabrus comicus]